MVVIRLLKNVRDLSKNDICSILAWSNAVTDKYALNINFQSGLFGLQQDITLDLTGLLLIAVKIFRPYLEEDILKQTLLG